ncbi:MAG: MFS transporter [Candidatus Izemoplasmatales bacterium]
MKKQIIIVLILTAFQATIHNLGHPVTPDLVHSLDIPDYMFGVFFAMMALGMMIASPFFGLLGDHHKKNRLIFFGLLIYSIGQIGFGFGTNSIIMVLFRLMSGLGVAGIVTLFVSYIIENSSPEHKTRNLAYYSALLTFFAGLGYKLGGFLNHYEPLFPYLHLDQYRNIFLLQGILNCFFAVAVLFFLKEDHIEEVTKEKVGFFASFKHMKELDRSFFLFLIAVTLASMASINISKYLDVYFIDRGYTSDNLGSFVFVTGIVSLISSTIIVPIIKKLNRDLAVIILIQLVSGLIILFVFRQNQFLLFMYSLFNIYVLLKAIYTPFEQSYLSTYAKGNTLGLLMGVRQSFVSIGMIVGPIVGGFLYDRAPLLVFDVSAILLFISFIFLVLVYQVNKKKKAQLEN